MREWEPFDRSSKNEDPWNYGRESRRSSRKPESHSASAGHVIGSCEEAGASYTVTSAPKPPRAKRTTTKSKRPRKTALLIFIVLFIISFGSTMMSEFFDDLYESDDSDAGNYSWEDSWDDNDWDDTGDDDFSYDVDPSEDSDSPDSSSPYLPGEILEVSGPSEIESYTGERNFTLSLNSCSGKEILSYQDIYKKVLPSVVTIVSYNEISGGYATGVILSEDGYILTNQHVVAGQSSCEIATEDDQIYSATLVGEDPNTDLAVLKVDATGLTPAEFGSSDELTVGDECFAIGNPLGPTYRGTFTNGIISALNRNVYANEYSMTLIQTTAALNSGNSGGPLINSYGQVIGINNMKIMSSSSTIEGLGFAIPSTTAERITNLLVANGIVEHPAIGITCYAVEASDPDGPGVDGILVATIRENADCGEQGLMVDDIITEVNGIPVKEVSDATAIVGSMHVGDIIDVTVVRDGETLQISFALSEQNDLG